MNQQPKNTMPPARAGGIALKRMDRPYANATLARTGEAQSGA
ncbi:MAG TPA: hypothetical protein VK730_08495 [Solirubrobacteraceae bacterium]|jgi:hypothetical protein|nr:hypothetical protein [Solirubrobacteraceae bacterium]